ncbi:hypothetical protein BDB01DRAFT_854352 [Pilobolus umbonatus]|nr:hypothetical protein BDB01DRAFT_854352 [Pilobolus umbonatus]
MNVSHLDLARIPTFPQFKDLDIDISEMTLEDAHFIKTSFPQLQKLTLTIQENVEDKYNIIDALIQPTLPDNLTIYCSELSNIDIIVNFVYQLNKRFKKENVSVVNKIAYNKSEYDNLTVLSTEYDPKSCLRIITTTVHYPYRLFKNFQLLEQIGGNLNKLQISDDGYNSVWDLEDINQQCPVLSELVFHSLELVPYSGKPKINKNLTKLTMTKCDIYQNTFKRVELSYPMLEELHLKGNKLVGIDEQAIVCHVHLKLNKLKLIRIYLEDPQTSYLNMVVVKAVDDTWVKLWSYCNEKKKMVVTEKKSAIHEIKLVKEGLLYVLISNTVEDVSFE